MRFSWTPISTCMRWPMAWAATTPARWRRGSPRSHQGFVVARRARRLHLALRHRPGLSFMANRLLTAVKLANRRVFQAAESHDDYTGMGTTMVAALVADGTMSIADVGDSRIYHCATGSCVQLTRDDSWVATVLGQGPQRRGADRAASDASCAHERARGARQTEIHVQEREGRPSESCCSAPTACTAR